MCDWVAGTVELGKALEEESVNRRLRRESLATGAAASVGELYTAMFRRCKEYISNYRKLATKTVYLQHEQQHER